MDAMAEAADFLADLRHTQRSAEALPVHCRPRTLDEAYAIQTALMARLLAPYRGHPMGYKVACTNTLAQELLHVDGPFYGRLLPPQVYAHPARLPAGGFGCNRSHNITCKLSSCCMLTRFKIMVICGLNRRRCR